MAELPILPFKVDAFLADTTYMSAEHIGCYLLLLLAMWRNGHGAAMPQVRDDERELARICRVSLRRWRTLAEPVLRPCIRLGGVISQKRLTDTWLKTKALIAKRAEAGTKRWAGSGRANASALHEPSNANQNQTRSSSSLSGREMTPQEFSSLKQRRAPLPVQVKERSYR